MYIWARALLMRIIQKLFTVIFLVFFFFQLQSQKDTGNIRYSQRKLFVAGTTAAFGISTLAYLNEAWYSDYNTGSFHLFNDNAEWLQMDKAGHVYSTYQSGRLMMDAFKWAGFNRRNTLTAGAFGFIYMSAIEIMDGFSSGWGFSTGDAISNFIGTSLAISQEYYWREQKFQLKFSYAESGLAQYNPRLLGENFYQAILKDYNGQTYWLSFNPFSFNKEKTFFPKWINISFGYSAFGMLGGHSNNLVAIDENGNALKYERLRRYYLSFDLDLTKIKTKSRILKGLFSALNILKFPAPALQLSNGKFRFYPIYL
jgi:hypothetical protein